MEVLDFKGMDCKLLKGKNAIITGCARGMGKKMVEIFASNGANIWACARRQTEEFDTYVREIASKYDVWVEPVYFDMTDFDQMKVAVKQILSSKQPVDILVNNAGITYNALFQMSTLDEIQNTMNTNFIAPFIFTQYIVKLMLRTGKGSIISIGSTAAQDANSGRSVYGASKAALITATCAIAEELGEKGIRANCIAPGITRTDMLSSMTDDVIAETIANTDIKRIGEPLDIANAALFLASDMSSYITGQVLRVDGCLQ